jgi:hypothetical protein
MLQQLLSISRTGNVPPQANILEVFLGSYVTTFAAFDEPRSPPDSRRWRKYPLVEIAEPHVRCAIRWE